MKKILTLFLLSGGILLSALSVSHAISITGTGHIYVSPEGGIIDDWFFTVSEEGTYEILVDSATSNGDPEINLFTDSGGTLSLSDFIENDDDGGAGQGGTPPNNRDSYISRTLGVGNYLLRVSEYNFGNNSGTDSIIIADFNNDVQNDWTYTLTIEGPAVAFTQAPVPEPTTIMLYSMGLLGFAAVGRRRYE